MKLLQGLFLVILSLVLSVAALLTASAFKWAQELPELSKLDSYEFSAVSQIFDRNGRQIGVIVPALGEDLQSTNRTPVSLEEVSPAALMAIVASEDSQFFNHYGFDVPALLKATYLEFLGDGGRGGSTITIQTVKNLLLTEIRGERSLERKIKELMLAIKLERRLTKSEILQRYINLAFWGKNFYGIRAASQGYFGKEPIDLTLAEGLYLARLIPAPNSRYDNFVAIRNQMRIVLDSMVNLGMISQEAAQRAWREPIEPIGWEVEYDEEGNIVGEPQRTDERPEVTGSVTSDLAPHLTYAVRNWLTNRFGEARVFSSGGLKVYTTIDSQMQIAANQASLNAEVPAGAELAIVGLNPQTGEVLAMVGGHLEEGEEVDEFNRALNAYRQPGSSFKPIIYATAVEQGGYTQASIVVDEATTFYQPGQSVPWRPDNHDFSFIGAWTLRKHLDVSRNIPVAKLVEAVTPEAVVARASELGYQNLEPYLAIALGSYVVTPMQHASAMGAFANGGVHVEPYFIERVEDADGNVLYEHTPRETRVWSEQTAYIILDMMHGTVVDTGGFSGRAQIDGRYVAGKTGTTNNDRDIWFVGMTPGIVSAVWIGYDDNRPIPERIPNELARENGLITSSRQPIYIWEDFVTAALRGRDTPDSYPVPEGISFQTINLKTGAPDPNGVRAAFDKNTLASLGRNAQGKAITITIPVDRRTDTRATPETPRNYIDWRQINPQDIGQYISN